MTTLIENSTYFREPKWANIYKYKIEDKEESNEDIKKIVKYNKLNNINNLITNFPEFLYLYDNNFIQTIENFTNVSFDKFLDNILQIYQSKENTYSYPTNFESKYSYLEKTITSINNVKNYNEFIKLNNEFIKKNINHKLSHIEMLNYIFTNIYDDLTADTNSIYGFGNNELKFMVLNKMLIVLTNNYVIFANDKIQNIITEKSSFEGRFDTYYNSYFKTYMNFNDKHIRIKTYKNNELYSRGYMRGFVKNEFINYNNIKGIKHTIFSFGQELYYKQFITYCPNDTEKIESLKLVDNFDTNNTKDSTIIKNNNEIIYHQEKDNVLVNKLKNEYLNNRKEDIVVYKLGTLIKNNKDFRCIIKMAIPPDALIVQPVPFDGDLIHVQKFRSNKAKVLEILDINYEHIDNKIAYSTLRDNTVEYIVSKEVYPDSFDVDPQKQCSHGIHFHLDKKYCKFWIDKDESKISTKQIKPEQISEKSFFSSTLDSITNMFSETNLNVIDEDKKDK